MKIFAKIGIAVALLASFYLVGMNSFAETIQCRTKETSSFSLGIVSSDPATNPASLKAKLKTGFLSGNQNFTLKQAPRKNLLNYAEYWGSQNFWLEMGDFHNQGHYSEVRLFLNQGTKDETQFNLECDLSGPIVFKNYCAQESDLQKNLFEAVKTSNRDLLEAMLSCGLDLRAIDEKGCTPLLALSDKNCGSGQFDPFAVSDIKGMVADLIKAGAVIDSRDPITQETSLIKVAHIQDLDSVMELVKAGADLNAQDKDGMTPLMRAVETRYLKMVEAFVAAGADLDLKNRSGQTALDIATANGSSELFDALAGASIVTVQANKEGVCSPMSLVLKLNQPNKIILKTENPMLMLAAKDLNINLMAGAGMDANVTITPQKAGKFVMTCGPQMGDGNPQGSILVQ